MADSILSVTIRDSKHPCSPYRSTRHSFSVQVFNCDLTPLVWKGLNFGRGRGVMLTEKGEAGGLIHGQFKVPPGAYLVRGVATCKNVVTDWAWVKVCCNQTVCVDLVPPAVWHCIVRTVLGLNLGTVDPEGEDRRLKDVFPEEVKAATEALKALLGRRDAKLTAEEVGDNLPEPPEESEIQ